MKAGRIFSFLFILLMVGGYVIFAQEETRKSTKEEVMSFTVQCPSFKNGEKIPTQFTCDGVDYSPALEWQNPPPTTKSFALICDDPDAPVGVWVHWIIYNIPATVSRLPENVDKKQKVLGGELSGALQGINSWNRIGYGGPCPPPGAPHRYFFKLYALDIQITKEGMDKKQLLAAMEGHILAETQLMGTYQRKR